MWVWYTQWTYSALRVQYNNVFRIPSAGFHVTVVHQEWLSKHILIILRKDCVHDAQSTWSVNGILGINIHKTCCTIMVHWVHVQVHIPDVSNKCNTWIKRSELKYFILFLQKVYDIILVTYGLYDKTPNTIITEAQRLRYITTLLLFSSSEHSMSSLLHDNPTVTTPCLCVITILTRYSITIIYHTQLRGKR